MRFLVLSLPRSRSAWLATFLEAWHEPLLGCRSIVEMCQKVGRDGACDTGAVYFLKEIRAIWPEVPVVVVHRSAADVMDSLERADMPYNFAQVTTQGGMLWDVEDALHVHFDDLDTLMPSVWSHCYPELVFPHLRYQQMRDLNVQVIPDRLKAKVNAGLPAYKELLSWRGSH